MKIKSFRICKYRSVADSGEIELLDPLTCIVGKNQSGKTALLRGLHKFNPHQPDPYDMRRDWPRGERTSRDTKHIVCTVNFELDETEVGELSALTAQRMTSKGVTITKDYEGRFEISFPAQPDLFPDKLHPNDIDAACSELPLPKDDGKSVGKEFYAAATECVAEAKRLASEGRFSELSGLQVTQSARLQASMTGEKSEPFHTNENTFCASYKQKLAEVEQKLAGTSTMHLKAHEYLIQRIPTFIYMDDYRTFKGRANLESLKNKRDKSKGELLTPDDETFLMILALSGLDLDQLIEQGKSRDEAVLHDRAIDLEDAAKTLTRQVSGRWGQHPYRIAFTADQQTFFTDIEQTDKDIGMIPLDEQSKGFQWFFSFDLHFMHDSNGTFEGCVLLLDEPGLHLHPGAQADLLHRLDAYSEKNTTIYSTHLPFLIDLREPARIKVIQQVNGGTVVSDNLSLSQPEERLTLQSALGMRANQSYLVATRNLVVEGVDDYWIVVELSNILQRSGENGLPDDVMVSAAGSASEAVYIATFMIGQGLQVVALFDSDDAGRTAEEKLRTKWMMRYKPTKSTTLLLGNVVDAQDRDYTIEDLFPDEYYIEKVRQSHAPKLAEKGKSGSDLKVTGSGPILSRVEHSCSQLGIPFNKGSAAKLIRKDLISYKDVTELPPEMVDVSRRLIASIRASFT